MTESRRNCHKKDPRGRWHVTRITAMSHTVTNCMWQKRFLWSHGSVTSIKWWLDVGSSISVTPQPASLHSSWPKLKFNFSTDRKEMGNQWHKNDLSFILSTCDLFLFSHRWPTYAFLPLGLNWIKVQKSIF